MFEPKNNSRTWGFRFSPADALTISIFAGVAAALGQRGNPLGWMMAIVAGHFFLFCNVFRIIRRRELIWAGLFLFNIGIWAWSDNLSWTRVLGCQLPVTVGLIFADLRAPGYHGIFANRLNPRLNDYLERRIP